MRLDGDPSIPDFKLPDGTVVQTADSYVDSPYGHFAMVLIQSDAGNTLYWWDGNNWSHEATAVDDISTITQDAWGTPIFAEVPNYAVDPGNADVIVPGEVVPDPAVYVAPPPGLEPFAPLHIDMGTLAIHGDHLFIA